MLSDGKNHLTEESAGPAAIRSLAVFPLWQKAILFSLCYFICAELGFLLSGQGTPFVTFWLPAGLYVAVLLLSEPRNWVVLALATFPANLIFDLSFGTPFAVLLFFYAANTLQAVTGAWLFRRFVAVRPTLHSLREFFGLIAVSVVLSTAIGATVGAATLSVSGLSASFFGSWKIWWGSNAMAILILSPFVLTWFTSPQVWREFLGMIRSRRLLEALLLLGTLVLSVWYAFVLKGGILSPQRAMLVPLLLWAGVRFGVRGATAINLLMSLLVGFFFSSRFANNPLPPGISAETYVFMMQFVLAIGSFVGMIPAIVLCERDKMLLQLSESEERFRNLAAAAFEGIAISENGRLVDGNEQLFKMFGYTQQEMIGHEILEWVAPEARAKVGESIRLGTEEIVGHRLLRKDGTSFHAEARAKIVRVGDRTLRMTAVRDITERERALEQIMEQAALLDETADAIIVCNLYDRVLYWNKGAERTYGWPAAEAVGKQITELLYVKINSSKRLQAMDAVMSKGEWAGELEHSTKDGRKLIIESRLSVVHDSVGRPKSMLSINTDITERKKIESHFMRAQRMESIGNLAGGIAHDLNNILAPIMMSIDFLKEFVKDAQALDILETIHVSATRGAAIVRQVLSFARGSEGPQIEIHPGDLIRDIHQIVKDTFPKNIQLQTAVPPDAWNILGDPTQLYQIILNLCVNARDAMPGGGLIGITVENRTVDGPHAAMHLESNAGPYVSINVSDTGVGIPKENLDKIFEPFFTTKEFGKGSGLGLSTLLAVVKSHRGFVNVESEPGTGTTFSVYLPAMIGTGVVERRAAETDLPRGSGELVLLIDDEDSILTIVRQTLETYGYRVMTAANGIEAMSVYDKHKNEIAVVLTDMMMPVMDGPATIQALKKADPAVKIIAASGLNANAQVADAAQAGIQHFLPKPYTAQNMLETLRKILGEA